jgi:hypothetical protein
MDMYVLRHWYNSDESEVLGVFSEMDLAILHTETLVAAKPFAQPLVWAVNENGAWTGSFGLYEVEKFEVDPVQPTAT